MSNVAEPAVRSATFDDAPEIARLLTELGYPLDGHPVKQRLEALQLRSDHLVIVAGNGTGRLVGWLHAERRHSVTGGERAEVVALVVDADARRGGIGCALVCAAEDWARQHGLPLMIVRSNVVRDESHAFYQKLGFNRSKTQHFYGTPLDTRQDIAS